MSRHQLSTEESYFFAENTLVSIFPSIQCPRMSLICGEYGPFSVPSQVKVPLWMALVLKKNSACKILSPDWLSVDALTFKLAEEENIPDEFSAIDPYWIEISTLLLSYTSDDIPDVDQVRYLLQKVKEIRQRKLDSGLHQLDTRPMDLKNIGFWELNQLKPHFIEFSNLLTDYHEASLQAKLQNIERS